MEFAHLFGDRCRVSGAIIPLSDVIDPVFLNYMVGESIAIEPVPGATTLVAPCDGILMQVSSGNHAFTVKVDSDAEILVQVGFDTAQLNGEGFKRVAEKGARVKVGDPVLEFDLGVIEKNGMSPLCPVVFQDTDEVRALEATEVLHTWGEVTAGESEILRVFV